MTKRSIALSIIYFGGFTVSSSEAWIGGGAPSSPLHRRPPAMTRVTYTSAATRLLASHSNSNHDNDALDDDSHFSNNKSNQNQIPKNITQLAEKKVRLAKAQAEIDRILNSPVDPPFDAESELQKVVSISPPLVAEGSAEYALEEQVSQMEHALYSSVKQTNFDLAAQHSKDISQMHIDDCGLVLQVNSRFYQAFSRKDLEEMRQVWLADRSCICIHPSHKPLVGIHAIQTSWDQMFQSSNGSFQRSWMEPQEIRLTIKATTAVVTCEEHVFARRFIRGQKRETELVNKLQATNIFRKVGGRWFLTYHHSSWHADSEVAKKALNPQAAKGGNSKSRSKRGSSRSNDDSSSSSSSTPSEIDKILGVSNFGPLLGDESSSKSGSENKPVKRVIMGSLSDILNGNLGGLLGGDDGDDDDDDDSDGADGNDLSIGSDGIQSSAIIRFNRIQNDNNDDDDEDYDDDDEDGDDDVDEDEMDTLDQIKDWARKDTKKKQQQAAAAASANTKSSTSTSPSSASSSPQSQEDRRRQGCIAALRKLANEGRISTKQKRSLLTDIISCSAKGELSMVEVAYDLLYCSSTTTTTTTAFNKTKGSHNNKAVTEEEEGIENANAQVAEDDDAEEEFADQCIVFAQAFSDYNTNL